MITKFNFIKIGQLSPIPLIYSEKHHHISPVWHGLNSRSVFVHHVCTIIVYLFFKKSPPSFT